MRKLKPQEFLDEVYPSSNITTKTVINWIKARKVKGEQTPTGRWLVIVDDTHNTNIDSLVKLLEAAA